MIFGVNPSSVESHEKYCVKKSFNFNLISDSDRKIAKDYNALKDNAKGILRTVYIINKNGEIIFAERGMPSDDELLDAVERLG